MKLKYYCVAHKLNPVMINNLITIGFVGVSHYGDS